MEEMTEKLADRFIGSALGAFIGDALGMPVEGRSAEAIQARYGGLLNDLVPGRFPAGSYTDDTEMMIGLLETLADEGDFDPELAAARFLANFHPFRGYGERIYGLMDRLRRGAPWDEVGTDSFGNGSAMRVGPIGFFYFDDPERLKKEAVRQALITHRHPEALAGAVVQAGAVGLAVKASLEGRAVDPEGFLLTLSGLAQDLDANFTARLAGIKDILGLKAALVHDQIAGIHHLFRGDVRAIEAVPPAITAFLLTDSFTAAVILAVNLGWDTDTLGAMAGAIAGAYYGRSALPAAWVGRLENGPLGRDRVIELCRRLSEIKVKKIAIADPKS